MEYNKNQYSKTDDKKVLHKVKKQWVVMSMALLMAIGGGAIATKVNASASAINNGNKPQTNANVAKAQLSNKQAQPNSNSTSKVNGQAVALHNSIVKNAQSTNQANSNQGAKANTTRGYVNNLNNKFNSTNDNQTKNSVSSKNVQNYVGNINHQFSNDKTVSTQRMRAPVHNVGDSNTVSNYMPVSVMYINKDGSIQHNISDNSNKWTVADVKVSDTVGSTAGFTYTDNNDDYTTINSTDNGLTATMNKAGATWNHPSGNVVNIAYNASNIKSSDINNIQRNGYQAWDSQNNRPLIIEQAKDANSIYVEYINQSGVLVHSDSPFSGIGHAGDELQINIGNDLTNLPYTSSDNNVTTKYQFNQGNASNNEVVTIPVKSTRTSTGSSIEFTFKDGNNTINTYNDSNVGSNKPYGSIVTINPSDMLSHVSNSSNYNVDPNDTPLNLYVGSDNKLYNLKMSDGVKKVGSQVTSSTFNVVKKSNVGSQSTIYVAYKDQNGHIINSNGSDKGTTLINSAGNNSGAYSGQFNMPQNSLGTSDDVTSKVSVPNNYTLIPGQNTKVISNGQNQVVVLDVQGKVVTINGRNPYATLNIQRDVQDYNSTGSNTDNYQTDIPDTQPTISARVGSDFTVSPGNYIPSDSSVSGRDINPDENSDVTVEVMGNNKLQLVSSYSKDVAGTTVNGSNTGILTIPFSYRAYEPNQAQSKIHIHYEAYNPVTNSYSSDIVENGQNTTISDMGTQGTQLNSNQLDNGKNELQAAENNVPRGYQLYGLRSFNGSNQNLTDDDANGVIKFGNKDSNLIIAVIPNVYSDVVYYRDQDGNYLKSDGTTVQKASTLKSDISHGIAHTISGTQSNSYPGLSNNSKVTSRFGYKINLANGNATDGTGNGSSQIPGVKVPKGYHIIATANSDTSWSGKYAEQFIMDNKYYPRTYTVTVTGNQTNPNAENDEVAVHIHELSPNEKKQINPTYTVYDHLSAKTGNTYTVNASDYQPSGFNMVTDNNRDASVVGRITPTGANKRSADFYYKANLSSQNVQPINVSFMDGSTKIANTVINPTNSDYNGENVNVATRTNNFNHDIPSPYAVVPGQSMNATFRDFSQEPLDIQVYNKKTQVSSMLRVHRSFMQSDGTTPLNPRSDYAYVSVVGNKNSTMSPINANDSRLLPEGFTVKSGDAPITVKFGDNGIKEVDQNGAKDNNNVASETYDGIKSNSNTPNPTNVAHNGPHTGKAQSVFVQFVNGSGKPESFNGIGKVDKGGNVGSDHQLQGYMNDDISNVAQSAGVPNDAHVDGSPNLERRITDQVQQVVVPISHNEANDQTVTIEANFETPKGTVNNSRQIGSFVLSDNQSSDFNASQYLPSSDYTVDGSKTEDYNVTNNNGTLEYNGNNQLQNNTVNFYYKVNNKASNIQPIFVHYINQNGVDIKDGSIEGKYLGQAINVSTGASSANDTSDNLSGISMNDSSDGYSINSNQNLSYSASNSAQEAYINVTGSSVTSNMAVNETFITSSGKSSSVSLSVPVSGEVGNDATVSPSGTQGSNNGLKDSSYPSDNKYNTVSSDTNDSNFSVEFGWNHGNHSATINPNSRSGIEYEQTRTSHNKGSLAGTVQVKFEDQNGNYLDLNGNRISSNQVAYLANGLQISDQANLKKYQDINNQSDGFENYPTGYNIDTEYGSSDAQLNVTPTFDGYEHTIHVIGNQTTTANVSIHRKLVGNNGNISSMSDVSDNLDAGRATPLRVGDTVTVNADDASVKPDGDVEDTDFPDAQQFTIVGVNGNGSANLSPTNGTFYYKTVPASQPAGNINLSFMNQNGQYINLNDNSDTSATRQNSDIYTINGVNQNINHYSDIINLINPNGQSKNDTAFKGHAIPTGYHLADHQNTSAQFNSSTQNITLIVYGNNATIPVNVNRNNTNEGPVTIYVQGRVGDTVNVNPIKYGNNTIQPSGYTPVAGSSDQKIRIIPSSNVANNNATVDKSTISFNYTKAVTEGQPVTFKFINQNGQKIASDVLTGNVGQTVDVLNPNDGGIQSENDNILNSSYHINNGAVTKARLSSKPRTIYVGVHGNSLDEYVKVYKVITESNGHTHVEVSDKDLGNQQVGNTTVLTANSYNPNTNDYVVDTSDNGLTAQTVTYSANEISEGEYAVAPRNVVFHYKATQSPSAPVTLHFVDGNKNVGQSITVTGTTGQRNNINSLIPPNAVPEGYHLTESNNATVTYSNVPQNIPVSVIGNNSGSQTFTVHQVFHNLNGTITSDNVYNTVSGNYGSDFSVTPYNIGSKPITVSGYHPDSTNANLNVAYGPNGMLTPFNSITYEYDQNYNPNDSDNQIGKIYIHYMNGNNEVDVESDAGTKNSTFDLTPYLDDIPESVNGNYDIDNSNSITYKVGSGSTSAVPSNHKLQFSNNTTDIYIPVKSSNLIVLQ